MGGRQEDPDRRSGEADAGRLRRAGTRVAAATRRLNEDPRLLTAARLVRQLLPGDSEFGDPLSTAGPGAQHAAGRRFAALTAERPGLMREVGLSALQVWQGLSEAQGRGQGHRELAILFTDLSDFSAWALEAGDTLALELLRDVGRAVEPAIEAREGEVVKRLGDGVMAVFSTADGAVAAALDARERVAEVEVEGHRPSLRAGVHLGHPRRLGGDYLGVDVNIAARLIENAGAGEVLASEPVIERLDRADLALEVRRRRRFRAKGAPRELTVYAVERAEGGPGA